MQDAVKKSFERRLNLHSAVSYVRLYAGHWLGAFMDLVSLVFVASVVLVVMLTSESKLQTVSLCVCLSTHKIFVVL